MEKEKIIEIQKSVITDNQNEIKAFDSVNKEINFNQLKLKKSYSALEKRYQNLEKDNRFLFKEIKSIKSKKIQLQEKNNELMKKFESISRDYDKVETELAKRKLIFQKYFGKFY